MPSKDDWKFIAVCALIGIVFGIELGFFLVWWSR